MHHQIHPADGIDFKLFRDRSNNLVERCFVQEVFDKTVQGIPENLPVHRLMFSCLSEERPQFYLCS